MPRVPPARTARRFEVSGGTRILFISGQFGMTEDGKIAHGMTEQCRMAWCNLDAQLKAAGMTFDNLVKTTLIIPDAADIPAGRQARLDALGERRPASTITVAGLANPVLKIAIEAIAFA